MMFRKHIKEEFGLRQFDIAPLIDVVFILLTFFMLTSSFIIHPGIKIDLPKAVTSKNIPSQRVNIYISSEDVLYLNGRVVTLGELEDFLAAAKQHNLNSVFIKSDKNATLGRTVEIWDICKSIGLTHVNIATVDGKQ